MIIGFELAIQMGISPMTLTAIYGVLSVLTLLLLAGVVSVSKRAT